MLVFRITRAEYASELFASRLENRWNSKGLAVIYTSNSRALACLENLAHFAGEAPAIPYRTMVIAVPDEIPIDQVDLRRFPTGRPQLEEIVLCREIGDHWFRGGTSAMLRVPSVLVYQETNFLLNPAHPDFKRIQIVETEDFRFDPRLKQ